MSSGESYSSINNLSILFRHNTRSRRISYTYFKILYVYERIPSTVSTTMTVPSQIDNEHITSCWKSQCPGESNNYIKNGIFSFP